MAHLYQQYLKTPSLLDVLSIEQLLEKVTLFPLDTGYKILLSLKQGGSARHRLRLYTTAMRVEARLPYGDSTSRTTIEADAVLDAETPNTPPVFPGTPETTDVLLTEGGQIPDIEEPETVPYTEVSLAGTEPPHREDDEAQETPVPEDTDEPKRKKTDGKGKKKGKKNPFRLKEFSGISPFGMWLLAFEQNDLDRQLKKEAKQAKKRALEESAKKSVTQTPGLVSEPLADILASQGHLDAAKKMYSELMVKFPEKSSYFAGKIEQLLKHS